MGSVISLLDQSNAFLSIDKQIVVDNLPSFVNGTLLPLVEQRIQLACFDLTALMALSASGQDAASCRETL